MDVIEKFLAKAAQIPQKPLSVVTFWFALVVVIYLLAQITWKLFPSSNETQTWRPSPVVSQSSSQFNLSELQKLDLFGVAHAQSHKPKVTQVTEMILDAPKTSLSIQLTGVVASTMEQNGLAIIASLGSQNTYGLGDKIKGTSASLKEVYADRIIISNGGRYETLMLDGLKYETNSQANNELQRAKSQGKPRRVDQRNNRRVAEELQRTRDAMLADPSKITDYLSISPVKSAGELTGYRLNSGKNRELFSQSGLKPNDLAKSINGFDLTQMSQALEVMAMLPELTEISLVVERDGQLVEIMFALPQQ